MPVASPPSMMPTLPGQELSAGVIVSTSSLISSIRVSMHSFAVVPALHALGETERSLMTLVPSAGSSHAVLRAFDILPAGHSVHDVAVRLVLYVFPAHGLQFVPARPSAMCLPSSVHAGQPEPS